MHTEAQPFSERRSFAAEADDVRTQPVDERHPTLRGLARGHNQLHDCLEEARKDIGDIKEALGLTDGKKPVAGLSSRWQSFRRQVYATTTSVVSIAIAYKLAVLLWPALVLAFTTLSHAALKGIF